MNTHCKLLFVVLFILTMVIYQLFIGTSQREKLLKNGYLITCKINTINSSGSKYKNSVCYSYSIRDEIYNDCKQYDISGALVERLIGVTVPLLYDTINPKINHILLYKGDFQSYNLNYPDSLKWIEELR